MERSILEQPFPQDIIKSRPGTHGRAFTYVEGHEYIKRLNDAFDGDWSFEIEYHNILQDEVVVMGKLTARGISKQAFGGVAIKRHKETGQPISLSDDLKAAATDSLKKASTLLGVGLHLYVGDKPQAPQKPVQVVEQVKQPPMPNAAPRLTQRQLSAIWSMARGLGVSADDVRKRVANAYSVAPEQLNKKQASEFISGLAAQLDSARGVA